MGTVGAVPTSPNHPGSNTVLPGRWLGHGDAEEAIRLQSASLPLQMKDLVDGDLPAPQHMQGGISPQPRFSCSCTEFRKKKTKKKANKKPDTA